MAGGRSRPTALRIDPGPFSLEGLEIGHAADPVGLTGATVLLFRRGARAAVDVRGGAPATRESAALDPSGLVPAAHAIVLAGGSAFGLDAAGGVMRWLEERGIGFPTPAGPVPIVAAAAIYDLRLGDAKARPDAAMGRRAAEAAREGRAAEEGNAGCGTGATVGKALGLEGLMKGGIGLASAPLAPCPERGRRGRWRVGALAVVNAFGDVVGPDGGIVAGCRDPRTGAFLDTVALLAERGAAVPYAPPSPVESTTLVAVVTDAPLARPALSRVARMAHDGLARAIRPVHTQWDGDVVYAASVAPEEDPGLDPTAAGAVAAEVVAAAILRGVRLARSVPGAPAAGAAAAQEEERRS